MQRSFLTTLIYFLAAAAVSSFWIIRQQTVSLPSSLLTWLIFLAAPLVFICAYPRYLFGSTELSRNYTRYAAILHAIAAAITTILFVVFGSVFWKNPLRDEDYLHAAFFAIVAVPLCLVAAATLLLKGRSTLANLASVIFWPYLLFGCWFL